ncbi:MAG: hypothetical protein WA160_00365 [Pseudobdellovibrio sp.]
MKSIFITMLLASTIGFAQEFDSEETPIADLVAKPSAQQQKSVQDLSKKLPAKQKSISKDITDIEALPEVTEPAEEAPSEEISKVIKKKKESAKDNILKVDKSTSPHFFGFHADLNIPHILNYGLDYWHSSKWFSIALNTGGYKITGVGKTTDLPNGANIQLSNQEAVIRLHPFTGSFYLGLGYGRHTVTLDANKTISITTPISGSADVAFIDKVTANYLLPHIGWLWTTSFGLTFGMDLGYLSPSSSSADINATISNISNGAISNSDVESTTEYKNAKKDAQDQSEKFGKTGLPYWTVLRMGWLF